MKKMIMYVVLGREDEWEAETYVVGVYSTKEKAQAIIDGVGKETFPNDVMWIDENDVDTFGWERDENVSKTFSVHFSGYCEIEAETAEEAEQKFWDFINKDKPLPQNIYDFEGIEEKTE